MKHPKIVKGYSGTHKELAHEIGSMTYDEAELFLKELSEEFNRQSWADRGRGRVKLSMKLYMASIHLFNAQRELSEAWEICEPFMKEND